MDLTPKRIRRSPCLGFRDGIRTAIEDFGVPSIARLYQGTALQGLRRAPSLGHGIYGIGYLGSIAKRGAQQLCTPYYSMGYRSWLVDNVVDDQELSFTNGVVNAIVVCDNDGGVVGQYPQSFNLFDPESIVRSKVWN